MPDKSGKPINNEFYDESKDYGKKISEWVKGSKDVSRPSAAAPSPGPEQGGIADMINKAGKSAMDRRKEMAEEMARKKYTE